MSVGFSFHFGFFKVPCVTFSILARTMSQTVEVSQHSPAGEKADRDRSELNRAAPKFNDVTGPFQMSGQLTSLKDGT